MKQLATNNSISLLEDYKTAGVGESIIEGIVEASALFEKLYTECYTRIFRYFSFRLPSKENAEDLTQTVFLKVCTSLQNGVWDGQGEIHYIFTVARNTLIDYFRRSKHTPVACDELVASVADSTTTSGPLEDKELRETIEEAMKGLRANEVQALRLRFFSDLDYRTIAEIMGKREDAVRQLVHRGLRSLKGLLGDFSL